jgi:nitrite reductase (NADH) small subunit
LPTRTVAKVHQMKDSEPAFVDVDGHRVGVYRFRGKYYAYENVCPHQGGPVCEGEVLEEVKCRVSPSGRRLEEYLSKDEVAIVCPWHGVRYDIRTGECFAHTDMQLTKFSVTVEGDAVKISY